MSYQLVIPRDLFNHAKVLKCYGQLGLAILDGVLKGVSTPEGLSIEQEDSEAGFNIEQNRDSGALYVSNLEVYYQGSLLDLEVPYNSKEVYPLMYVEEDDSGYVFLEDGSFSSSFLEYLEEINNSED
jgi:hypothetical protein